MTDIIAEEKRKKLIISYSKSPVFPASAFFNTFLFQPFPKDFVRHNINRTIFTVSHMAEKIATDFILFCILTISIFSDIVFL